MSASNDSIKASLRAQEPDDTIANSLRWTQGFIQTHVDMSDVSLIKDCLFLPFLIFNMDAYEEDNFS